MEPESEELVGGIVEASANPILDIGSVDSIELEALSKFEEPLGDTVKASVILVLEIGSVDNT